MAISEKKLEWVIILSLILGGIITMAAMYLHSLSRPPL